MQNGGGIECHKGIALRHSGFKSVDTILLLIAFFYRGMKRLY